MAARQGVSTDFLMENAGKAVADVVDELAPPNARLLFLVGKGNKAGDGLVAARLLASKFDVSILLSSPVDLLGENASKMFLELPYSVKLLQPCSVSGFSNFDFIIDALVGFNLKGAPKDAAARLINLANSSGKSILAIDLPTGLHPDTGAAFEPCIRAAATVTLALPKTGLLSESARPYIGALYLADIGMPSSVFAKLGLPVSGLFSKQKILRIF